MKFFEVEQKYRLKDPRAIRRILKKLGAKKTAGGTERNEFFDRNDFFKKQKVALRLRRFGGNKATLTLKGPRIKAKFTKRREIETPVDYAAAKALLKFLGCKVRRQYIKEREAYRLNGALITVDHLRGFGWFLEIETSSKQIAYLAKKIGLRESDREERSYLQMLFGWKH